MTDKIIRCRDCKHWMIDKFYEVDNPRYRGFNPIDEETGKMRDYICGVCTIKMDSDMVEIDIDCGAYGGFNKVTVETNNNFFCGSAEEK